MSRPKGSKNKKKANPKLQEAVESLEFVKPQAILESLVNYEPPKDIIILKGRRGNLMIGVKPGLTLKSTPYPKEWATMGKVEKLQWLTANRQGK